jgi:hypothetical protein
MTNPTIKIVNVATGEEITREMTEEEIAEHETRVAEFQSALAVEAEKAAEEAARLSAKLAIYAKLGLTEEEINTLIS